MTHKKDQEESQISHLESILKEKEQQIEELRKSIENYQNMLMEIHQSMPWQILRKYNATLGKIIPLKLQNKKKDQKTVNKYFLNKKAGMNNKPQNKDIICFPIIDWKFRLQRPQHLMNKFNKNGHRVFYLSINMNPLDHPYEIESIDESIYLIKLSSPVFFDIYKDKFSENDLNVILENLRKLLKDFNIDAICYVMFPTWERLVSRLRDEFGFKILFDYMDEFTEFSNVSTMRKKEEIDLIKNSDLVMASSNYLLNKAKVFTQKVLYLPNACEFEHFAKTSSGILKNYPRPIIGYFGEIAEWFDKDLIEYIARKRTDLTFVFIGYTYGANLDSLKNLKNLHFLGERPYSELPYYLHDFDVCIIPFKNMPIIEATHPVKVYEYLSAGKPVVSTKMPELLSMADLCYLAEDKRDFLIKIDMALHENNMKIIQRRIEFAAKNTWQQRFDTLYNEMQKIPSLNLFHHD